MQNAKCSMRKGLTNFLLTVIEHFIKYRHYFENHSVGKVADVEAGGFFHFVEAIKQGVQVHIKTAARLAAV